MEGGLDIEDETNSIDISVDRFSIIFNCRIKDILIICHYCSRGSSIIVGNFYRIIRINSINSIVNIRIGRADTIIWSCLKMIN